MKHVTADTPAAMTGIRTSELLMIGTLVGFWLVFLQDPVISSFQFHVSPARHVHAELPAVAVDPSGQF